tara:strand:+ start:319 stop:651 length:333 start_codon:yes stop_codon:yes gene_type:complete
MNFILKKYTNIDNNNSLQLDMSCPKNKINLENIKHALKKNVNNKEGDYILQYSYNNHILEIVLFETDVWVYEYNKDNTLAYINISTYNEFKFFSIKSKSESGYNHSLNVI